MHKYLSRRLLQVIPMALVIATLVFVLVQLAPGDPAARLAGGNLSQENILRIRSALGLDLPPLQQYWQWTTGLLKGDMGYSLITGRPVADQIMKKLGNTAVLALSALGFAVVVSVIAGVMSSVRRYTLVDYSITTVSFLGISIPAFWFGIMLVVVFSVELHWLPSSGMATYGMGFSVVDRLKHLIMPTIVLGLAYTAELTRFLRSEMIDVLRTDYVLVARSKGLSEKVVIYKHALRNALLPYITVLGIFLPRLMGGAVLTETIFAWPGMGLLAKTAAFNRDYPLVTGIALVASVLVLLGNVAADALYAYIDPRIRYE